MTETPLFSVIIPTYNHGAFIGKCLQSVRNQGRDDWEAIVINNSSEDNTIEIVQSINDPRIRLISIRNNGIIGVSRNCGISVARGDWIALLDSDDWWYPRKLATVFKNMEGVDIIYHDVDVYSLKGKVFMNKLKGRHLRNPIFCDLMKKGNALPNSSVVVRKSIIHQAGGFSEDRELVGVEDIDLWLKIARMTERFRYIRKSLGAYWLGDKNISHASEKRIFALEARFHKHMEKLDKNDQDQARMLLSYGIGRLKMKTGRWKEAQEHFRIATKSNYSKVWIRSHYFLGLNGIRLWMKKED